MENTSAHPLVKTLHGGPLGRGATPTNGKNDQKRIIVGKGERRWGEREKSSRARGGSPQSLKMRTSVQEKKLVRPKARLVLNKTQAAVEGGTKFYHGGKASAHQKREWNKNQVNFSPQTVTDRVRKQRLKKAATKRGQGSKKKETQTATNVGWRSITNYSISASQQYGKAEVVCRPQNYETIGETINKQHP